jgi:uroporphyrinogen-III synthase
LRDETRSGAAVRHHGGVSEPLAGRTVALLETRRRVEIAELVRRRGGIPLLAPCLREVAAEDRDTLHSVIREIGARALDLAVFQTGVGTAAFLDAAAEAGCADSIRERLAAAVVVERGPKPLAVLLREGIRIDRRTREPHTTDEVVELLDADLSRRVALMVEYGAENAVLHDELRRRGAEVVAVTTYAWGLPDDVQPILHLLAELEAGRVDDLMVTSASQVDNLFRVAEAEGAGDRLAGWLNDGVVVAAVGPVSAGALQRHHVAVDVQPERPKMVPLVDAVSAHATGLGSARPAE